MRPFVFLNSTSIHEKAIEKIIFIEMVFIILTLALAPHFIYATFHCRRYHLNIRLYIILGGCHIVASFLARPVLIYHQLYGRPFEDIDLLFQVASLVRVTLFGYTCSIMTILAFDRCVATFHWSWYERDSASTLLVFLSAQSFGEIIGCLAAFIYAYDFVPIYCAPVIAGVVVFSGLGMFVLVNRYNMKLHQKEKRKGARIGKYSVRRSYQISENLRVMALLQSLGRPTVFLNTPCSIFFLLYFILPQDFSFFVFLREISIALFDLWVAMYGLIIIVLILRKEPSIDRQFTRIPHIRAIRSVLRAIAPSNGRVAPEMSMATSFTHPATATLPPEKTEADVYFIELQKSWDKALPV